MTDEKARFNEAADRLARKAAHSLEGPEIAPQVEYADAVRLVSETNAWIPEIAVTLSARWWELRRKTVTDRRNETLAQLYPPATEFDWIASNMAFKFPSFSHGFWHSAGNPGTAKWIARARTGALATSERRRKTDSRAGPNGGPPEAATCPCCGHACEDDLHALTACHGAHSNQVVDATMDAWKVALARLKFSLSVYLCFSHAATLTLSIVSFDSIMLSVTTQKEAKWPPGRLLLL